MDPAYAPSVLEPIAWDSDVLLCVGVFEESRYLGKDKNRISLNLITASPQRHTHISNTSSRYSPAVAPVGGGRAV